MTYALSMMNVGRNTCVDLILALLSLVIESDVGYSRSFYCENLFNIHLLTKHCSQKNILKAADQKA